MKQKRNIRNNVDDSNRRYFNPYETASTSSGRNSKTSTSRHTYSKLKHTDTTKRASQKATIDSTMRKQTKKATKKKSVTGSKVSSKTIQRKPTTKSNTTRNIKSRNTITPSKKPIRKKKKLTKAQRLYLKRRRQIQAIFRICMAMILVIGGIWGSSVAIEKISKTKVSSQVVKVGSLDTSTMFDGVIFRNEKVVVSEDEGYVRYTVAEGEKVEKDGTVYVLVDEENLATTTSAKEEIDSEIYNEAENRVEYSTNQDKLYNLDQEVKENIEEFYKNRYESSTSYVNTLRSKLDTSVTSRTELYASEQEESNKALIQLKQDIEANLEKYHKGKSVEQPGVISYYMDGHESENAMQTIEALNHSSYSQYRKGNTLKTLAPSTLNKEDPIYKLVLNNEWYVVTYINTKDDQWIVNQSYDLTFSSLDDQSIKFTLVSKTEEEQKTKLVFKSSNQIGKFLNVREVSFSIGDKDMSGLKIPLQSIVELNMIKIPKEYTVIENEVCGVYRKKGEQTSFVPITLHQTKDDMYYIIQDLTNSDSIQLNDTLVLKDSEKTYTVTDMEVATGVYVINSQVAKFKQIELLTQNEEYALVKNNANSQLKEMDKIISNPKSISKDQLLEHMSIQNE